MQIAYTTVVYKRKYTLRQAFCDWWVNKGPAIRCFIINNGQINTRISGKFIIAGGDCPTKPRSYSQVAEIKDGTVINLL
jgi:hypothetical protein